MVTANKQNNFNIRCEWGERGIDTLITDSDSIIIVDVLSFSTCVAVAVDNQAIVYPFYSTEMTASDYADKNKALLATKDRNTSAYTLSPTSLMTIPAKTRIVLPSPNGSLLSTITGTIPTFAGCLRNAKRVAQAASQFGKRVSVIPAGERWFEMDFSLRPSMEDWIGAGAIIYYLSGEKSIEAQAAEYSFRQFRNDLHGCFQKIGSGIELIEKGFAEDVRLASDLNISDSAPFLQNSAYQAI
ncbi:MAG: 2-phosphosulfolactate phosphatase [Phototrophicaceae bacterium]